MTGTTKNLSRLGVILGVVILSVFMTLGLVYSGYEYGEKKYLEGIQTGQTEGKREIIDSILISAARNGNVEITQGGKSVTLTVRVNN